jgi:hypothetical protein
MEEAAKRATEPCAGSYGGSAVTAAHVSICYKERWRMEDMPTVEDVLEAKATMAGITSIDDTVWQQFTPPPRALPKNSHAVQCPRDMPFLQRGRS